MRYTWHRVLSGITFSYILLNVCQVDMAKFGMKSHVLVNWQVDPERALSIINITKRAVYVLLFGYM